MARLGARRILAKWQTYVVVAVLGVVALVTYTCATTDWPYVVDRQLGISSESGESFRLRAYEHEEELRIVFAKGNSEVQVVGRVVVDVGWNDRYIVATSRSPDEPGGTLSFYYVDTLEGISSGGRRGAIGPLTQEEFEEAKGVLGLPDFVLHYPELR